MSNTDHIDDLQADKSHDPGCVTKCVGSDFKKHHGSYRKNGYDEHKSDPKKSDRYVPLPERIALYGPPEKEPQLGRAGVARTPRLPMKKATPWTFTGKNFKSANEPFVHMYHHMVTWETMSESFTMRELLLFQIEKYNINDGKNLIILPCFDRVSLLVGMFKHPNDHPTYTARLIKMLKSLKKKVKGDEAKHLKKKQVAGLKKTLDAWSKAEWKKIADAGMTLSGAHVDAYPPSSVAAVASRFMS